MPRALGNVPRTLYVMPGALGSVPRTLYLLPGTLGKFSRTIGDVLGRLGSVPWTLYFLPGRLGNLPQTIGELPGTPIASRWNPGERVGIKGLGLAIPTAAAANESTLPARAAIIHYRMRHG